MGDKPISFRDADGNFVSAADVWNEKKLEELFNRLNPKRALRLARTERRNTVQEIKNSRDLLITGFVLFAKEKWWCVFFKVFKTSLRFCSIFTDNHADIISTKRCNDIWKVQGINYRSK